MLPWTHQLTKARHDDRNQKRANRVQRQQDYQSKIAIDETQVHDCQVGTIGRGEKADLEAIEEVI
jgi:hypothetical protein